MPQQSTSQDIGVAVERKGEMVELSIHLADGAVASIQLPLVKAPATAAALLQLASPEESSVGLFDQPPFISTPNPRMEIRRTEGGQVVMAVKPRFLGPILLELDDAFLRGLRDALTALLG